jgi:hypothetical protein
MSLPTPPERPPTLIQLVTLIKDVTRRLERLGRIIDGSNKGEVES